MKKDFGGDDWMELELDTTAKEFLVIGLKRTQDVKSDYVERATAVAQKHYKSLLDL
jgi:hypothetical protein